MRLEILKMLSKQLSSGKLDYITACIFQALRASPEQLEAIGKWDQEKDLTEEDMSTIVNQEWLEYCDLISSPSTTRIESRKFCLDIFKRCLKIVFDDKSEDYIKAAAFDFLILPLLPPDFELFGETEFIQPLFKALQLYEDSIFKQLESK